MVWHGSIRRSLSPSLNFCASRVDGVAAHGAYPAFFGEHHGNRLAFDGDDRGDIHRRRCGAQFGAAGAERAVAEFFSYVADFRCDACPAQLFISEQGVEVTAFLGKIFVLFLDLDFFEPAQAAQAHVQNGLGLHIAQRKPAYQPGFRVILFANDPDHFIEIEEYGKKPVEDFQPVFDRLQPVRRTAAQHLVAMIEPGLQHSAQAQHAWPYGRR